MSDRIDKITVAFREPLTREQAWALAQAISLFRDVAAVFPGEATDIWVAEERARLRLQQKLFAALQEL